MAAYRSTKSGQLETSLARRGQAWLGKSGRGVAWRGMARFSWGKIETIEAGRGVAGRGWAWHGTARRFLCSSIDHLQENKA